MVLLICASLLTRTRRGPSLHLEFVDDLDHRVAGGEQPEPAAGGAYGAPGSAVQRH